MLKFASSLTDANEYLVVWGGQSLSRPWGTLSEYFSEAKELSLDSAGQDLTTVTLTAGNNQGINKKITVLPTVAMSNNQWVGAQLRIYDPSSGGTSYSKPLRGYATVTANSALEITVDWQVDNATDTGNLAGYLVRADGKWQSYPEVRVLVPYQPTGSQLAGPCTVTITIASPGVVTWTAHGLANDNQVVFATTGALPTGLTAGTIYFVRNKAANTFEVATSAGGASINTSGSQSGVQTCTAPSQSPQVIPYPATTAEKVAAPGFTVQAAVTSFSDLGVFLPYTYLEGIWSHGISEIGDSYVSPSAHPYDNANTNATQFAWTNTSGSGPVPNSLAGGYLRVQWTSGAVAKLSWALINTNTATQVAFTAWQGDGSPVGGANVKFYAWIPHYFNNPWSFLPGKGFDYPTGDMQPCFSGDGRILNRPRGINTQSYALRAGPDLRFAMQIALATGKRVNLVTLGINSSGQVQERGAGFGFGGTIGWYDEYNSRDWTPSNPTSNSLYARLKRLVSVVAPNALLAEGNAKPAKVLAIGFLQGEEDAITAGGRLRYAESIATFKTAIRKVITDAGMSPYFGDAKIPFVQEKVMATPYMLSGSFLYYGITLAIDGDVNGLVNDAIAKNCTSDLFSGFITIDDLPRLSTDLGHLNGVGAAEQAHRLADLTIPLIDRALSFGSTAPAVQTEIVSICNLALTHIGDSAAVTSLDPTVDSSVQAARCAQYYPLARDAVLAMREWTFASKRVALTEIINSRPEWDHAYVLPADVMRIIAITPSDASDDFVMTAEPDLLWAQIPSVMNPATAIVPRKYVTEQDASYTKVIYTDQESATLRYQAFVTDATQFPSLFRIALSWKLAAMLAGPTIKGDQGRDEQKRCLQVLSMELGQASMVDANQRNVNPRVTAPWISARPG